MVEPRRRVAAEGPGAPPFLELFGCSVPITDTGIVHKCECAYQTACTEGANMGPGMPGPIPCANSCCPPTLRGAQGPGDAEGCGGFSWRCHQPLAGGNCLTPQAVEQSRGGSLVTAQAPG